MSDIFGVVLQKNEGQVSYPSPESTANHRMIDMGAEHGRYVFIFLKQCLYGLELKGEQ